MSDKLNEAIKIFEHEYQMSFGSASCHTDREVARMKFKLAILDYFKEMVGEKRVYYKENEKLTGITAVEKEKVLHGIFCYNSCIDTINANIEKARTV